MRLRALLLLVALTASLVLTAPPAGGRTGAFRSTIAPIPAAMQTRMIGRSWHRGCPVALGDLRLVTAGYWGFDGRPHTGQVIVNKAYAGAIASVLRRLYAARFPIRRLRPVDDYGGDDFRSIEADNTSAFNCRAATGSTHWSQHAYGAAIDVNPIENPYVSGSQTSHAASRPYLDRSRIRPGMAYPGGVLLAAFRSIGWGWGGDWAGSVRDYQHFSATGS
jgi:hypothetical protein